MKGLTFKSQITHPGAHCFIHQLSSSLLYLFNFKNEIFFLRTHGMWSFGYICSKLFSGPTDGELLRPHRVLVQVKRPCVSAAGSRC